MYLKWKEITTEDFSDKKINSLYEQGYLFGRNGFGAMYQTRSLRINLDNFELSSENRRILKKTEEITINNITLPYTNYHWSIGKLAKDFYNTKFGQGTFSANKVKELLTSDKSNFNLLFRYTKEKEEVGYAICRQTDSLIHYSYPFYSLEENIPNLGLGMMVKAILWAKNNNLKFIYLGSYSRPSDIYKLQFEGLEWCDGNGWSGDLNLLKKQL